MSGSSGFFKMLKQSIGSYSCCRGDTGISFVPSRQMLPLVGICNGRIVMFLFHGHVFGHSTNGRRTEWSLQLPPLPFIGQRSILKDVSRRFCVRLDQIVVGFDRRSMRIIATNQRRRGGRMSLLMVLVLGLLVVLD